MFAWRGPEDGGQRQAEILPSHCSECKAEIQRLGYDLVYPSSDRPA